MRDGQTDADAWTEAIDMDTGAVIFQQPNFLGAVEDAEALAGAAQDFPAVVVGAYDPIPLGILKPPGECGVDVAVGEGQSLGNRLDYGGPSFGFFAATEAYLRGCPGASPARPPTPRAAAASCSRCRRASSTSAARRPRRTSARRRR
jgi:glycine dehydrogenase subunit 1